MTAPAPQPRPDPPTARQLWRWAPAALAVVLVVMPALLFMGQAAPLVRAAVALVDGLDDDDTDVPIVDGRPPIPGGTFGFLDAVRARYAPVHTLSARYVQSGPLGDPSAMGSGTLHVALPDRMAITYAGDVPHKLIVNGLRTTWLDGDRVTTWQGDGDLGLAFLLSATGHLPPHEPVVNVTALRNTAGWVVSWQPKDEDRFYDRLSYSYDDDLVLRRVELVDPHGARWRLVLEDVVIDGPLPDGVFDAESAAVVRAR